MKRNNSEQLQCNWLILVTSKRRWGTSTDASTVMAASDSVKFDRLIGCSDDDNDCPVHSLMSSLHDLRGLPLWRLPYHLLFRVVLILAAHHIGRHGRTLTTCDAWLLTVTTSNVWRGYWPIRCQLSFRLHWKSVGCKPSLFHLIEYGTACHFVGIPMSNYASPNSLTTAYA